MADPLIDALAKFTPAPGFDRDALLFEAGRRSVKPSWRWPTIAALLAVAQVVTLVALWPRTPAVVPAPTASPEPAPIIVLPPSPPPEGWTAGSSPDVLAAPSRLTDGEFIATRPLSVRSVAQFD